MDFSRPRVGFSWMRKRDEPVPERSSRQCRGLGEAGERGENRTPLLALSGFPPETHQAQSRAAHARSPGLSAMSRSTELCEGVPFPSGVPVQAWGQACPIEVHWNQLFSLPTCLCPKYLSEQGLPWALSMHRCSGMVSLRARRAQWPRAELGFVWPSQLRRLPAG